MTFDQYALTIPNFYSLPIAEQNRIMEEYFQQHPISLNDIRLPDDYFITGVVSESMFTVTGNPYLTNLPQKGTLAWEKYQVYVKASKLRNGDYSVIPIFEAAPANSTIQEKKEFYGWKLKILSFWFENLKDWSELLAKESGGAINEKVTEAVIGTTIGIASTFIPVIGYFATVVQLFKSFAGNNNGPTFEKQAMYFEESFKRLREVTGQYQAALKKLETKADVPSGERSANGGGVFTKKNILIFATVCFVLYLFFKK